MINGVINIYKEKGFTSHDVVAKLRGILNQKRIGHTGTLDPDAEGVLPICLGKATGVCGMLTDQDKAYEAVMLLGTTTDTQDVTGTVIRKEKPEEELDRILAVIQGFVGEQSQIPPMYSAVRHNGKRLYELARQGVEVERAPRSINVRSIRVHEYDEEMHTVRMTITCSKGTYIRTLCNDMGERLGCGACMAALKRIRVGSLGLDTAITLGQAAARNLLGTLDGCIIPVDSLFGSYAGVTVAPVLDVALHNGNPVPMEAEALCVQGDAQISDGDSLRVYDSKNAFVGIYRCDNYLLRPVKMFYDADGENA
jgi:tRNA pseudouridine55 synthase